MKIHRMLIALRKAKRRERGFTLIAIILAIGVLSATAPALLGAMSTGSLGVRIVNNDAQAGQLAISEMEYVKNYTPYLVPSATYPSISAPTGFTITATASAITGRDSAQIEKITVTVVRNGATLRTLVDYKGN